MSNKLNTVAGELDLRITFLETHIEGLSKILVQLLPPHLVDELYKLEKGLAFVKHQECGDLAEILKEVADD